MTAREWACLRSVLVVLGIALFAGVDMGGAVDAGTVAAVIVENAGDVDAPTAPPVVAADRA